MGCASSSNKYIISKIKNENVSNLISLSNSIPKISISVSRQSEENKIDDNKINYVNHFESIMDKMIEINSKYNILEQISHNNMITDYKLQLKDDLLKFKTLKIIRKKLIGDENKVLMEIKLLNSLKHEKLIKIEDCYYDTINYYFIIEYFSYGKLSDIIKKNKFSENQIKYIIY